MSSRARSRSPYCVSSPPQSTRAQPATWSPPSHLRLPSSPRDGRELTAESWLPSPSSGEPAPRTAPLTLTLSPDGGERIGSTPSPSLRERAGVRVGASRGQPTYEIPSPVSAEPRGALGREQRLRSVWPQETRDRGVARMRPGRAPRIRSPPGPTSDLLAWHGGASGRYVKDGRTTWRWPSRLCRRGCPH